jgi:ABC-2 type transport system ATP-binding protein
VAIINQGKILACDTPANLKRHLLKQAIFNLEINSLDEIAFEELKRLNGVQQAVQKKIETGVDLELVLEDDAVLSTLIAFLTNQDIRIQNLHKREASLEDVFVSLVGQSMKEVESDANQ